MQDKRIKEKINISLGVAVILLMFFTFGLASLIVNQKNTINSQSEKINELNQYIGEYQYSENFWEDYIDLLDEIYQGKINEAVLQERIKWLEEQEPIDGYYTQQEVYEILEILLNDLVDLKYDDSIDVSYDEQTKTFTVIEYNQYGEVFDVDAYTLDEIIYEILGE